MSRESIELTQHLHSAHGPEDLGLVKQQWELSCKAMRLHHHLSTASRSAQSSAAKLLVPFGLHNSSDLLGLGNGKLNLEPDPVALWPLEVVPQISGSEPTGGDLHLEGEPPDFECAHSEPKACVLQFQPLSWAWSSGRPTIMKTDEYACWRTTATYLFLDEGELFEVAF